MVLLGGVALASLASALLGGDPFAPSDDVLEPPSLGHLLGTDALGREVGSRLLHGAGTALWVATWSVLAATVLGTTLGVVAGYAGGILDDLVTKVGEVFQVIPRFLLALVAAALFGPSRLLLAAVFAVTFWPMTARLARAEVLSLRERGYTEAARALGAGHARIVLRHLLPGAFPLIVVNASFQAGTAVLMESGLAFLGLSDRNLVSWGTMLADAQSYVAVAWWMSLFPGLAVGLTVIGMNLAGDGLNDVLDARHPGGTRRRSVPPQS